MKVLLALRIVALLIGGAFLYLTLLYEDDQRKIQNKLTDLWCQIEEYKKQQIAFMQTVARLTSQGLDRLLGPQLISFQSVGVCLCYSYASFLILLTFFDRRELIERSPLFDDINIPLYLILGILPVLNIKRKRLFLKLWFLLTVVSFPLVDVFEYKFLFDATWAETVDWISESRFFYLGMLMGVSSDILFVSLLRRLLRSGSNSTAVPKFFGIVLVSCVCVFAFFLGPLLYEQRFFSLSEIYSDEWLFTVWVAVTSNLLLALIGQCLFSLELAC